MHRASQGVSTVLTPRLRSIALSFANSLSIGFRSGCLVHGYGERSGAHAFNSAASCLSPSSPPIASSDTTIPCI